MASSMTFNFKNGYREAMRIDSSGNFGIGTSNASEAHPYYEWEDILKMSETNPAIKSALDKLKTTYYLSKDNGNGKT